MIPQNRYFSVFFSNNFQAIPRENIYYSLDDINSKKMNQMNLHDQFHHFDYGSGCICEINPNNWQQQADYYPQYSDDFYSENNGCNCPGHFEMPVTNFPLEGSHMYGFQQMTPADTTRQPLPWEYANLQIPINSPIIPSHTYQRGPECIHEARHDTGPISLPHENSSVPAVSNPAETVHSLSTCKGQKLEDVILSISSHLQKKPSEMNCNQILLDYITAEIFQDDSTEIYRFVENIEKNQNWVKHDDCSGGTTENYLLRSWFLTRLNINNFKDDIFD
ncbi:unnamed protein product [Hermetia illucens]|uniref:Uncharacterized protein n=2 Tax=Hermetia illucens TaxID=343691 RepID=A0A7R8Z1A9_HERIL|nr:uncharacterized protein LOC119657555 isoform X1 [Hermetia illucens]CAD7091728.1 unnamed protein product [Hermetia illucens]